MKITKLAASTALFQLFYDEMSGVIQIPALDSVLLVLLELAARHLLMCALLQCLIELGSLGAQGPSLKVRVTSA